MRALLKTALHGIVFKSNKVNFFITMENFQTDA